MVRSNPPGYCVFCRTQSAADAAACASCGKPLPRALGYRAGGVRRSGWRAACFGRGCVGCGGANSASSEAGAAG